MVEQPIVYYAIQNLDIASGGKYINSCDYLVADEPIVGFELHPAFTDDTNIFDKIYIGAFEATGINNKLSSVGGGTNTPLTNKTRPQFRTMAQARGTGWQMITKQIYDLNILLMAIEYMSFDTVTSVANGVSDMSNIENVGQTYSLDSNGTGKRLSSGSASFTWRWQENIYGNSWKHLDGINIRSYNWYVKNSNWVDDTSTGYTKCNNVALNSPDSAYVTRFAYNCNNKWIFMPGKGNSSTAGNTIKAYYVGRSESIWVSCTCGFLFSSASLGNYMLGWFNMDAHDTVSAQNDVISSVLCARFVEGGTVNE